jgi:hypothetical protein
MEGGEEEMTMRFLFDPQKHLRYPLKNGTFFEVSNYQDELLRNGTYGASNPRKQGELIDTLETLLKIDFNGNVKLMSEVLSEVYAKPEYTRQGLYKILPSLKEIRLTRTRQRKLLRQWNKYFSDQVARDFARKQICKEEAVYESTEELGTPDIQQNKVKRRLKNT